MPAASVARRLVYLLASFAPAWALVATFTGGVGWVIGPLRLSSRQPWRPLLVGVFAAAYFVWRYSREERADEGRWLAGQLKRAIPFAVLLFIILGCVIGVRYGSFAAAGSDSYGYVSQAHLWRAGTLRVQQPLVEQVSWPNREWVFAPLGYQPQSADGTIVPKYPAGLPIIMALFLAIFGDNGPFYVAPVFGALAIGFTYLLGREATGSRAVASIAALLLLASPAFLTHLMVPMSDVPTAAVWTLVALVALKGDGSRPLLTGMIAGLALLIRPNLILLALVPACAWRFRPEPLVRYALGLAPWLLAIGGINTFLYGDPLTFGYGTVLESYSVRTAPQNLVSYARWLVETQTLLVALALIPLFVKHSVTTPARVCLAALLGLTFVSYLCYVVFNHWFYLRFLLPAFPALFVLMAAGLRTICSKLPVEARVPVAVCLCAALVPYGVNVGSNAGIFRQVFFEQRYVRAAAEVAAHTPATAAILAVQHSGSVRHHGNRVTLRYDWMPADRLDAVIRDMLALGHHPFLVVEDWEEAEFRARFAPYSRAGRLDWSPLARVPGNTEVPDVRLYDLAGSAAATQP